MQKFRVEGIPNPNPSTKAWSHSNEINIDLGFDTSAKDTTLIPSGFNPSGVNPIFRISNPAISVGQASMQIYNRWGEIIFKGDAILGWDGTYNNEICLTGIYIYIIEAEFRNKREIYQGTITIIN
jgi:gliding motility-associated-like protein